MLILIDTINNTTADSIFELISFAEMLAGTEQSRIRVIIAGENVADISRKAARFGHDVIALEHPDLRFPNPDFFADEAIRLVDEIKPRYVIIQHTMRGCQIASRISAAGGFPCITGVESFIHDGDSVVFCKSIINGKITVGLVPGGERAAFTVLPGAFRVPDITAGHRVPGQVLHRTPAGGPSHCRPLGIRESAGGEVRLEESDVIIAAGRGIGTKENLDLIRAVARLFPNAAVGASRTVVDQKWLPYAHQIGVTGRTVAPKLYMACGISGAQQHIAGMKGSQTVVAVNKDPHAAIFSIADYIIVEDLTVFLPLLIEKHAKKR
ncbi:MAG: electron transfer flavoprotein subunit alpha/FixB family protein [Spirochaetes bacterium]|nr:electron transfer flavoprotein subunit alpha/FixB family protein [Spirochaetota bacterium]